MIQTQKLLIVLFLLGICLAIFNYPSERERTRRIEAAGIHSGSTLPVPDSR